MTLGQVIALLVLVGCFMVYLAGGMTLPLAFGFIAALALAMMLSGYVVWPRGG